ncbi:MAG: ABC transporter ATP-binding protein [Rhodospirillales bacterium]|nr:ABC transporter ATP-binding protein [Rhodospirillales bacterium]
MLDAPPHALPEPLLATDAVDAHYGPVHALHAVSVEIRPGELVTLVGGNGAGKTTLLRVFSGVLPVSGGSVRYDGRTITRMTAERRVLLGITQVPEGRQVLGPMSVEDNLVLGAYTRTRREASETLEQVYGMFPDLKGRRDQAAGLLSGGQQQMLAIARALMSRPRILLLDEPSMGLSPILVDEVFETIVNLRDQGTTIFLVEQNAYMALSIADRGYVLEAGQIMLADQAKVLMNNDQVKDAYLGL